MTAAYDFFLHVTATFPPWLLAMLLGWLTSITITQTVKYLMPLRWRPDKRQAVARIVAFVSGAATVAYLMPTFIGALLALVIGVWAPLAYRLFIYAIQHRFPWLADVLSADIRGTVFGRPDYSQKPRSKLA